MSNRRFRPAHRRVRWVPRLQWLWYDLWCGLYIKRVDGHVEVLYLCPLPTLVFSLTRRVSFVPHRREG